MKKSLKHLIEKYLTGVAISSCVILAGGIDLSARPAMPGILNVTQPDGTQVTIRMEGGARNHRIYTTDGYLLTRDAEGFYVFADADPSGMPLATSLREINPEERSASTTRAISAINQTAVAKALVAPENEQIVTRGPGLFSTPFPRTGIQKSIAILVEFADLPFTMENPKDYFYRMLNEEGFSDYGAAGSARDYYISNSNGIFQPEFDVYGPVMLEHGYEYYGKNDIWGNDTKPWAMASDACLLLDDIIDFTQYDRNDDGYIDNVYIFYAGYGEADGGPAGSVWPHSWAIHEAAPNESFVFDGVILDKYACSNEMQTPTKQPDGNGAFVHEFSHVIGLPDLYATGGSNSFTPGNWSILDIGSYNNTSRTPPNYSAYEKYALDWMKPKTVRAAGEYELRNMAQSGDALMIPSTNPNEFYILENRQQIGFDEFLPGHGMLIWHIDFQQRVWDNNTVNNNPNHQYVDLIEADNVKLATDRETDAFPGTKNITSFTCETTPSFVFWNGDPSPFDIEDIAESEDGVISMRLIACKESGINTIGPEDREIIISGNTVMLSNGSAEVYDLSGRKMATISSYPVYLQAGVYVISGEGLHRKIIIR